MNFMSGFAFDALPGWGELFQLPVDARVGQLADPTTRAELARAAQTARGNLANLAAWDEYVLEETSSGEYERYVGITFREIGRDRELSPFDALCDVVVSDRLRTILLRTSVNDDPDLMARRLQLWRDPRVLVGASDAGAHLDMIDGFTYTTALLGPIVRDLGLLSLEEAVHLITQRPAMKYGFRGRGVIEAGAFADIVLFDPTRINAGKSGIRYDLPEGEPRVFAAPHGIKHVFVSGVETVCGEETTDAHPGRVLRSGRDTCTVSASQAPST